MKRIIAIIVFSAVMLTLGAATYYVGAEGGVTTNTVISGGGYRNYEYSWAPGYKASVPVIVEFNDTFALETGLSMYGKYYISSQMVTSGSYSFETYNLKVRNGFLELPASLRLTFRTNIADLYVSVGGYMGLWLYGSRSGKVMNLGAYYENVDEVTDLSLYNRFDAGLNAKYGFALNIGAFKIYAAIEMTYSLTDLNAGQKYNSSPLHNFTYSPQMGFLWGINK